MINRFEGGIEKYDERRMKGDIRIKKRLNIACLNVNGITDRGGVYVKLREVMELIREKRIDILAMTETWLNERDLKNINEKIGEQFIALHSIRRITNEKARRGSGGVSVIVRRSTVER